VRFPIGKAFQLAATISLSLMICADQTATDKPLEPSSIGVFFSLDSSTQTLKRLPQEDFKKHSGGFGSITQSIRVSGEASAFRFAANDKITFVFKVFRYSKTKRHRGPNFSNSMLRDPNVNMTWESGSAETIRPT
jgi:hypothetical protein